jgi:methylase of polypeptide subunit release factors
MDLGGIVGGATGDGLVNVRGYVKRGRPADEVAIMEKAVYYKAQAVFFEAPRDGRPSVAQAFIYRSNGPAEDPDFAELHKRLWSWGGVPLVYRVTPGLVQLFRCGHKPDFESHGRLVCNPVETLDLAARIAAKTSNDPWWDFGRLRNGTLWDDPDVCKKLLSADKAAQKTLIKAVKSLYDKLNREGILPGPLQRKLLILSVLIKYLEERKVFEDGYFGRFLDGATQFFEVLADGPALVRLLDELEERFNGNVFRLSNEDRGRLAGSGQLGRFARFVEAKQESGGQLTLWERYSFADLPVELISHIYQIFVRDSATAVYTPHFLVRLMLSEVLDEQRLDRLRKKNEIILDPGCGSGIFLVEAYKRLVLHWRSRNRWRHPSKTVLRTLMRRVHGVDLEPGAVELTAFSLCLALCEALQPEEIRASIKLFPPLQGKTIHEGCFFKTLEQKRVKKRVGVIVGNPPFTSSFRTEGAKRAYKRYQEKHGSLPDKQLAYLFLHESMEMLTSGGVLSMLQNYNFLYNQKSRNFRRTFLERWNVREILDFISVPGLFVKGGANTKVVAVVAESARPLAKQPILHATFRRSGRANAEQGFDLDYYDMHWLPRQLALENDGVWRSDLFGGGRVLSYVDRLRALRTLGKLAAEKDWEYGEGYVPGGTSVSSASHIVGKSLLPAEALTASGIDPSKITVAPKDPIDRPRSREQFTPPMLLVRQHMDLFHGVWTKDYLTYMHEVYGFCAPTKKDVSELRRVAGWLESQNDPLRAYVAVISARLFTQRGTALSGVDIRSIPYPTNLDLALTSHERLVVADIVHYYRDLIRFGEDSVAMKSPGIDALPDFNRTFVERINSVYGTAKVQALKPYVWPGVICQPFTFRNGKIDWTGADELKGKLDVLLQEKRGAGLNVTRIARLYDGTCIFMIKPDRLRYWLPSIALRDADETLADLWNQGY